ncbi:hypothetical protein [Streptomyces sp. NPDC058620]|uniref:hypothetical protein n=1 Tax=Streptomyces sp. NPDC058620 TaxID=3346560 RepID=UPI00364F10E6
MALPEGVSTITITDDRTHPDGGPMRGRIVVRPAPALVTNPELGHIAQGDATARWVDGVLTLTVLAADAAGYDPTDYTHTVYECPDDADARSYPVRLTTALGETVKLAALAPVEPYTGDYVLVPGPRGEQGLQGIQGPPGTVPTGDAVGVTRTAYKLADEAVTASAVVQTDDHLTFTVTAGGAYSLEGCLLATGDPAGDLMLTITAPPGSIGGWTPTATTLGTTDGTGSVRLTRLDFGAPSSMGVTAAGVIVKPAGGLIAGADGVVTVQWAQAVSNATATILKAASWLHLKRMG